MSDGDATLNICPSFLLVPAALEDMARVLMTSETDPSQTNSKKSNPARNTAEALVDATFTALVKEGDVANFFDATAVADTNLMMMKLERLAC